MFVSSVADMTYQFGLMRALGMKQTRMMSMLAFRCAALAVPASLLGLLQAVLIYIPIGLWFSSYGTDVGTTLEPGPVVGALLVGIAVPVLANMIATREALSITLRAALSFVRTTANEVTVTRIRMDEMGIEPWKTFLALTAAISGGMVFYLVPYAFLFREYYVFFLVMEIIFAGMVAGFAMIVQPLLPMVEKGLLYCMLWGSDKRLKTTISGNLAAHRGRSARASLVATLCVAFIIFCTVGLKNHADAFTELINCQIGADLVVTVKPKIKLTNQGVQNVATNVLPYPKLSRFLAQEKARGDESELAASAFVTKPLSSDASMGTAKITNFAWFPTAFSTDVIGIERSFFEAAYSRFGLSSEEDSTAKAKGAVEALYTDDLFSVHSSSEFVHDRGWQVPSVLSGTNSSQHAIYDNPIGALVPAAFGQVLSLKPDLPMVLELRDKHDRDWLNRQVFVWGRAYMSKLPGIIGMTSYSVLAFVLYTPTIVSLPTYRRLLAPDNTTLSNSGVATPELAYAKLFIKLRNPSDGDARERVKDTVRAYVDSSGQKVVVLDAVEAAEAMGDVVGVVLLLSNLMGAACLMLFFFLCTVTFTANIHDNAWELGVLRAIGLTQAQVMRIYIYEAVALVVASVIGGLCVGISISSIIIAQFCIFTEMPFDYNLPVVYLILVILVATGTAVLASYFPAAKLLKNQISSIIKGAA
eukprot:TRINITY_DN705_c0_g2_i2.p1 TRINITY_DN705_c0_g2~~TRINITY_DN705_c0_g2_i2.p1  ORF type:complete len:699 (+),score=154.48 TRINITY_DN705_c0_g2_i2:243-2339(+)